MTDNARCIRARYEAGITKHKGESSGVLMVINDDLGHEAWRVYDTDGIGGGLMARDYKDPKRVAIPVLTPERAEKRQNGRRFKENGEPMFTLTAQDKHGVAVKVKEATAKGYAECRVGGGQTV